jgi:hypothetical protein
MARRLLKHTLKMTEEREVIKENRAAIGELAALRGEHVISLLVRLCFVGVDAGKDILETFPDDATTGYINDWELQLYDELCTTLLHIQTSVNERGATERAVAKALLSLRRALP